jgi:cytochrome oxidase Cu insertion factor (SCO1/SenC/PrrC family)
MAATPQPHLLDSWVAAFASFDTAHGWAVNLFAVVALAVIGALLVPARPVLARAAVLAGAVLCLADWVLVEDLGFMGGVGTDPNTMVPMIILLVTGCIALTRAPAAAVAAAPAAGLTAEEAAVAGEVGARAELTWAQRLAANPTHAFRSVAAAGALAVILVGTAPMAVAATDPHADPLLAQAVDGSPEAVNIPAPSINLVDQHGRPESLADLRGKALAITFLDPVCTSDCPVIAQELKEADNILGSLSHRVEMVAIDANPRYIAPAYLEAFDRQENLDGLPNWLYLTGSLPQLQHAWRALGAFVAYLPGGAMIDHSDFAYVIDPRGHIRYDLGTDPGPATAATESSFAVSLAATLQKVVGRS